MHCISKAVGALNAVAPDMTFGRAGHHKSLRKPSEFAQDIAQIFAEPSKCKRLRFRSVSNTPHPIAKRYGAFRSLWAGCATHAISSVRAVCGGRDGDAFVSLLFVKLVGCAKQMSSIIK
jgi:hypothetical protein